MTASANAGIVYILSNVAMPGYIKIGRTDGNSQKDVLDRMRELYTTGVPRLFNCEYAAIVDDPVKVESAVLYAFDLLRVNPRREFLEGIDPVRVRRLLELVALAEVTPIAADMGNSQENEVVEKPPRAENFKFSMVDIPVGATLVWTGDPAKTCRVVNQINRVEYEAKEYSLSRLSAELKGYKSAQGSLYWFYENETLQERRQRLEDAEGTGEE